MSSYRNVLLKDAPDTTCSDYPLSPGSVSLFRVVEGMARLELAWVDKRLAENLRQQGPLLLAASFEYKKPHLDAQVGELEWGTEVVFAGWSVL